MGMLYAAIDIHKHVFQAATLDPESGELVEARLPATREALTGWLAEWDGSLVAVLIEATCGWRGSRASFSAPGSRCVSPSRCSPSASPAVLLAERRRA